MNEEYDCESKGQSNAESSYEPCERERRFQHGTLSTDDRGSESQSIDSVME